MKPIDSWRPAQTTLLVEVVRGAAGLFVPAAAASIHKTSLFVEHGVQTMIRPRGRKRPPRCTTLCVCGVGSQVMKGQACRCGGEGTTIACVLAVSMTCVTCLVSGGDRPSRVGSSYAPLGRSVAPLCINRCTAHSGVWLPTEGGACLDKCCYRSLIRLGLYRGSLV